MFTEPDSHKVTKPWTIRDVPGITRLEVKGYALSHGLSIAQALEFLVHSAANNPDNQFYNYERATMYFKKLTGADPRPSQVGDLLSCVSEINEQLSQGLPVDTIEHSPNVPTVDMELLRAVGLVPPTTTP